MVESLSNRHRSVIGQKSKEDARKVTMTLLGGSDEKHKVFFGPNASSLFERLAHLYVNNGFLKKNDHVILATENHSAHVVPWMDAISKTGASLRWWTVGASPMIHGSVSSPHIHELLCDKTRLVCLSHSSNVLGSLRDIRDICGQVRKRCPRAHLIVDGVAAAPHVYPDVNYLGVDWYCVSFHKIFGPHIGAIIGKLCALSDVIYTAENIDGQSKFLENGTLNYEACNGIVGLGQYFAALATFDSNTARMKNNNESYLSSGENSIEFRDLKATRLSMELVRKAYERISISEMKCLDFVKRSLERNHLVRLIADDKHNLPIISFVHMNIPSKDIVDHCSRYGVTIRCGTFLMNKIFQDELEIGDRCTDEEQGIVRASFCHYNTIDDATMFLATLDKIDGW
jgi:selenocysteine lyase/cysteine desulfurase